MALLHSQIMTLSIVKFYFMLKRSQNINYLLVRTLGQKIIITIEPSHLSLAFIVNLVLIEFDD